MKKNLIAGLLVLTVIVAGCIGQSPSEGSGGGGSDKITTTTTIPLQDLDDQLGNDLETITEDITSDEPAINPTVEFE